MFRRRSNNDEDADRGQADGHNNDNDSSENSKSNEDADRRKREGQAHQSEQQFTAETIYEFYKNELMPMIMASIPILFHRLTTDVGGWLMLMNQRIVHFLAPRWMHSDEQQANGNIAALQHFGSQLSELLEQTLNKTAEAANNATQHHTAAISDFMVQHFDTNDDGHISASELLNMTEIIAAIQQRQPQLTAWEWFSREWPLMDWKVGVFLWRTFGGVLLVLCVLSIIPGRLHSTSGKVLRWPILGLTYFLIAVELGVYIVIRLVIRLAETLIATPSHRKLRYQMSQAKSYEEWYLHASALDKSQKRDMWQTYDDDDDDTNSNSSYRYNWRFIRQLIKDMKMARRHEKKDSLLAMAILQQCTRKNVGGIMSEDLFSYTNTGEPKQIVREFCSEVVRTLRWVTDEAIANHEKSSNMASAAASQNTKQNDDGVVQQQQRKYEERLGKKVRGERSKIWKTVVDWTTLPIHFENDQNNDDLNRSTHSSNTTNTKTTTSNEEMMNRNNLLALHHKEQLIQFLKRARAAYGRTSLCLSGGAMMGLYHFGHIMGLVETDCLPNIISGTSAGSAIGALVCTRTDEELRRDMTPQALDGKMRCFSRNWPDRLKSFYNTGAMFDVNEWMDMIRWFTCGDLTFQEAYDKTGRVFCITLCSTTKKAPPVLLNYISAPNVVIASAVIASAAVPGLVHPVQLQYKDSDGTIKTKGGETYFDGSIETDIPVNGLAEMLNCQFFIACQCNPHVVPFFFDSKGGVGRPNRWSSGDQVASWRGGFLLAALELYLKNDMKAKFVFLKDLEAAVGFTSTMMTQEFVGSTTIVPQVRLSDYIRLFSDPDTNDLDRYFQGGSVAAYRHAAMIRLHYSIADALDECLEKLEQPKGDDPSIQSSERGGYKDWNADPPNQRRPSTMPSIISAALTAKQNHRTGEDTSTSDDDSYEQ